jgi:hypothetical protein
MLSPYSTEELLDVLPPAPAPFLLHSCLVKLLGLCLLFVILSLLGAGIIIGMIFVPYLQ